MNYEVNFTLILTPVLDKLSNRRAFTPFHYSCVIYGGMAIRAVLLLFFLTLCNILDEEKDEYVERETNYNMRYSEGLDSCQESLIWHQCNVTLE